MAEKSAEKSTKKPTINQKITTLEQAVDWFYGDDFSLDQAPAQYRAAVELAHDIENDLKNLKNKIEVVDKDFSKE